MNITATRRLHAMRRRLTLLLTALAAVGLVILALLATIIDASLRADEAATHRQGLSSRLAAYVYPDDAGGWNVDGIIDDTASAAADAVLVATRDGTVLYSSGAVSDYGELLSAGIDDDAEVGVAGTMSVDGSTRQAAAAPFWDFDQTEGAVLVSATRELAGHRLRNVVWIAAAALTALSGLGAWFVAGRVVRPIGEALEREERFLSTAAHDIRTPVGRIRALAESALRTSQGLGPSSAATTLQDELRRVVAVAAETTNSANDLLLAGRIDADRFDLRLETVRLDELVAGFEDSFSNLAVAVDQPVEVRGDPLMLRHAIANVLANAHHHGRSDRGDSLIEASVQCDGPHAVVVVSDNGPGLGGREPALLFERYGGRADRRTEAGGGLGLWIVATVIAEHQGRVSATERDPGPGTTVEIRLPVRPES